MTPAIRPAGPGDTQALHRALRRLARHLGAEAAFTATPADYAAHSFGAPAFFQALVAEDPDGALAGAATFFPEYSTMRGRPGVYLQDLWVEPDWRGSGLGRRLLAHVLSAARAWQPAYVRLSTHVTNPGAVAFYTALGFTSDEAERSFMLEGATLHRLEDQI